MDNIMNSVVINCVPIRKNIFAAGLDMLSVRMGKAFLFPWSASGGIVKNVEND
jgi:hypothetical protein